MFESYIESKKEVLRIVDEVTNNPAIDKKVLENSRIEQDVNNLKNGEFKIALIAPFSAGKSTFINSLIGQDLLSMEITAETSVITKVKYATDIKLEIKHRNGQLEHIPAAGMPSITVSELKAILESKTTVKGDNTEDNIEEVKVYYPIEMCKDKVEIVDTPGLFARHEKHKDITTNIMPSVNAVIFMIDPESVGQVHFTEIIQNYVRNADKSSMERDGKHIFFVINKIDKFDKKDIQKARIELEKVLADIIPDPQIYEVSAYYAMLGKMYMAKTMALEDIRKDRKVIIPNPEEPEYPLSGKEITARHIPVILEESKIRELENGLEKYLEVKNEYLITNVASKLSTVIEQSIIQKMTELENIKTLT